MVAGVIVLDRVTKRFAPGTPPAVDGVSLTVHEGETLVLLGTSGCGKTTTLKMINRLIEPTEGSIEVDGRDAAGIPLLELRRSIGYVFQDIGLFPHMTVAQNAAIVPRLLGWSGARRSERVRELLRAVELDPDEVMERMPRQLSGGQQQRVAIARALAADPKYLLMDEPFGALDAVTRDQLQGEIIRLRREMNKTIVFVTHDIFEAVRLADRIAVMHAGRIEQCGRARELIESPASDFVRTLFDSAKSQAALLAGAWA